MSGHIHLEYCPDCGLRMKCKEGDWVGVYSCPEGHRYEVTRGDAMGGSSDSLHRLPSKKVVED